MTSARKHVAQVPDVQDSLRVRHLGHIAYHTCLLAMKEFTDYRDANTIDELWVVEHEPVYTVGMNIRRQNYPKGETGIPIIETDRGGDITYHGPGQVVVYMLVDIRRKKLGIRQLVNSIEQSVIETLDQYGVSSERKKDAPGVYVSGKKIAALGLRVRKGCSYHGLSFNYDMDLGPFSRIPPCGYQGLEVTRLTDLVKDVERDTLVSRLLSRLQSQLGYNDSLHVSDPGAR